MLSAPLRLGIITNPHSKLNKLHPTNFAEWNSEGIKSWVTQDLEHLHQVLREFMDLKLEFLAINGGDGTISQTLSAVYKILEKSENAHFPKILLLRGGTMNVLADNLKIKHSAAQALRLFYKNQKFEIQKIRPLVVDEQQVGFIFGTGVAPRFLQSYYQKKTDELGAALHVGKYIASYIVSGKRYSDLTRLNHFFIDQDHHQKSQNLTSIGFFSSVIEKFPFGIKVFEKNTDNSTFTSINFDVSPRRLIPLLPYLIYSRRDGCGKKYFRSKTMKIQETSGENFDYTVDGELLKTSQAQVQLSLGPEIQFIV